MEKKKERGSFPCYINSKGEPESYELWVDGYDAFPPKEIKDFLKKLRKEDLPK